MLGGEVLTEAICTMQTEPIPRLTTLLGRGARKKCPHCGKGPLFRRWVELHDRCSVCGIKYLENEGDLWGYLLIADRALFILPLVAMIYFQLYNPNSFWFFVFAGTVLIGFIFTLPHRTGMSLAIDYYMRRKSSDLSDPSSDKPD